MLLFCVGAIFGYILGSVAMVFLIRETKTDEAIERGIIYGHENPPEKPQMPLPIEDDGIILPKPEEV